MTELYDNLKNFMEYPLGHYTHVEEYDLNKNDELDRLDADCSAALEAVTDFKLSYDITATHKKSVHDGLEGEDVVSLSWIFWKAND